jgi:outer membrane protein
MSIPRQLTGLLCVFLLLAPGGAFAGDGPAAPPAPITPPDQAETHPGWLGKITNPYRPMPVSPPNLANSGRLESLMRAGNIYLSLQDAIALALENNIDIEIQRYGPQIADAAVLLAEAGGFARGVSTTVTAGPASASVSSAGTTPGSNQNATSQASAGTASAVGGSVIQQSGPSLPNLDPMLIASASWAHATTPEISSFVTGTASSIQSQDLSSGGIQQGFLTGTIVSLGLNNSTINSNSFRNNINPAISSSLGVSVTQHLLQGFGTAVNSRQIRIAKNNREVSDLTFKLQVETTVAAVMELYWDLVAFNEAVRVAKDARAASETLLENNKQQVDVGTLAPIEVTRAEAEIASDDQQVTLAETHVLQQETIIKNALSRNGIADPVLADAHIIATDQIRVPGVEPISPIQEMTGMALSSRPELAQSRIQIQNQQLTIRGSKNSLLPTLDLVANISNSALAGQNNALVGASPGNPFFIGGYGTVLTQLFARNFPNYSAGFNLNIPIRNRAAQSQVINDELTLKQQVLGLQRLENQVRVDVQNGLIGLTQARAQYLAATRARVLQEETLDAEQKKLSLGASTIYNVILAQRDLVTAQSNEVAAEAAYAKAKVEMDRATGQILNNNNISLDEAFKGVVSRPPSPLPATPPGGQQ